MLIASALVAQLIVGQPNPHPRPKDVAISIAKVAAIYAIAWVVRKR